MPTCQWHKPLPEQMTTFARRRERQDCIASCQRHANVASNLTNSSAHGTHILGSSCLTLDNKTRCIRVILAGVCSTCRAATRSAGNNLCSEKGFGRIYCNSECGEQTQMQLTAPCTTTVLLWLHKRSAPYPSTQCSTGCVYDLIQSTCSC